MKLFAFLALAGLAIASPLNGTTSAADSTSSIAGAAFFATNDPKGNSLVVTAVHRTGKLSLSKIVSTGGKGSHGNNSGSFTGQDGLFSQGSVIAQDDMVFVVNAGSNSVSMFQIMGSHDVELVSQVSSGGEFPVSVAYSSKQKSLCVLNGGAKSIVRCFDVSSSGLGRKSSAFDQDLHLNQVTPPAGPPKTASDIIFNHDSSALLVSVKGDPMGTPGYVSYIPFTSSGLKTATKSTPNGGALPFSLTLIPNTDDVFATDPATGADLFNFASGSKASSMSFDIPGNGATCWSDYSSRTGTVFTSDTKTSVISEIKIDSKTLKMNVVKQYPLDQNLKTIDIGVGSQQSNDYLYVNGSATQTLTVLALNKAGGATTLQTYNVGKDAAAKGVMLTETMQGMAVAIQ